MEGLKHNRMERWKDERTAMGEDIREGELELGRESGQGGEDEEGCEGDSR